ncbi:hypothetical protein HS088_TW11G01038 [Tripterygium wilfordii]|uniref:Uncharacterized protein n=1 Tax=Tripterygium wilfordii TaxID=458696 RepID=A0A7J7D4G4_TRIWF|nr:hypothetical protein HS088_TW11G01038 [Tripterygium wilfordii]
MISELRTSRLFPSYNPTILGKIFYNVSILLWKWSRRLGDYSRPFLKDQKRFPQLVDPRLHGRYPRRCLNYAIAITAMCLNEEQNFRPFIGDILVALEYLASQCHNYEARVHNTASPSTLQQK